MIGREIIVVGGGPAGLGAAIGAGDGALVLEKRQTLAGMSGSIELDGAVFDLGGHSFHTPHPGVRKLVYDSLEMCEQKREARCFAQGTLIQYPFQKHFRDLKDSAVVDECAHGLESADGGGSAAHFEDYLIRRFGPGIATHFLLPYNRKLWGRDLKRLCAEWAAERVAAPSGEEERFELSGGKRKPLQDDTVVAYPARGGFGEIFLAIAKRVQEIRLGTEVARIDPNRRQLVTGDGELYRWRHLVSTIPLCELLNRIDGVPAHIKDQAALLEYLSLQVVLVVIDNPVDSHVHRIYVADADMPAHKIALNHTSSDFLRALPRHGIMAEVSCSSEKKRPAGDTEAATVENLLRLGLIGDVMQVRRTLTIDVKYAYPVPTHDRDRIVKEAKAWLAEKGIHSVGRFGDWAYVNSDECLNRGLRLGTSLVGNNTGAEVCNPDSAAVVPVFQSNVGTAQL